jgi:putative endonuclease
LNQRRLEQRPRRWEAIADRLKVGFAGSMPGHVYIMASQKHGTLYTGVTSDLYRRVLEHRQGDIDGFTRRYGVNRLVWHRHYDDIEDAIADEKRIKRWRRKWKLEMIEAQNPEWIDLFDEISR